jgi:hypothetical protein
MSAKSTPDPRFGHHVHFYETERFLIDVVAEFLLAGLTAHELVILLATPSHRRHICGAMSLRGFDVEGSIAQRQFTCLDAEKTLSAFMDETMPDEQRFESCLGTIFKDVRLGRRHLPIRVFGEMVNVLVEQDNPVGALRLEELWNELGHRHGFSLLCGYSKGNIYQESQWRYFEKIREQHHRVIAEGVSLKAESRTPDKHIFAPALLRFVKGKNRLEEAQQQHLAACSRCSELHESLLHLFRNPDSDLVYEKNRTFEE